jgi:hypothetical protein
MRGLRQRAGVSPISIHQGATMSRTLRPPTAFAVVALISVIGAGCGSNAPSETGAADRTGTAGDVADEKLSARDEAVKFAECIRAHGVGDFPDPNAENQFKYGVSVTPAVWKRATTACRDLLPPGTLSAERTPDQQSAALTFARCIRDNGVKDFPDPVNGEPLVNTYKIPSSNKPGGMAVLNAAMQKCGKVLREAAGGQG